MRSEQWNRHRHDNAVRVAEELWRGTGSSRARIARALRLDRSTVGAVVDHLVDLGIARELPADRSTSGGRPPVPVVLDPDYGSSIGIEIGDDAIELVVVNLAGAIVEDEAEERRGNEPIADVIVRAVSRLSTIGLDRLLTIGIGVPGIVDSRDGEISHSRSLNIREPMRIGPVVEEALGVPVAVLNDADACALGELEYGGVGHDLLFVLVRFSYEPFAANAGLGIVLDGRLREAHSGAGREFRSPFVAPDSLDQFAVTSRHTNGEFANEDVALGAFAEELGAATAFLVHALDLRNIVLGGDVSLPAIDPSRFQEKIQYYVQTSTVRPGSHPLAIRWPREPARPVAFGASAAALRRLFQTRRFPVGTEVATTSR